MITEPTVFILGAGASAHYGFPLGNQYKTRILDVLCQDRIGNITWESLNIVKNERIRVRDEFMEQKETIDHYLIKKEQNKDTEALRIGKTAIAGVILEAEKKSKLTPLSLNWYEILWEAMKPRSLEEFEKNNIAFITFNYDRSLEYFLHCKLRSEFHEHDEMAVGKWMLQSQEGGGSIYWYHIYGLPAQPYFWKFKHSDAVDYGVLNMEALQTADKRIELQGARETAKRLYSDNVLPQIECASKIVFLGFGFAEENLRLLTEGSPFRNKTVWATTKGLGCRRRRNIDYFFKASGVKQFISEDSGCFRFLKKHQTTIFR